MLNRGGKQKEHTIDFLHLPGAGHDICAGFGSAVTAAGRVLTRHGRLSVKRKTTDNGGAAARKFGVQSDRGGVVP